MDCAATLALLLLFVRLHYCPYGLQKLPLKFYTYNILLCSVHVSLKLSQKLSHSVEQPDLHVFSHLLIILANLKKITQLKLIVA